MATQEVGWAPANPWFKPGFKNKEEVMVDEIPIFILPFEYFLATKFTAFKDRGGKDPRASHDYEDIVYLLNYSSRIKEQIFKAEKDVQIFLKTAFLEIINSDIMQEAIIGNLYYENQMVRFNKIIHELKEIAKGV
ncbi:hypothetical protein RCC89_13465 [Cytophagaceae bacterium ABcell3]|nr:hypothetical protein RCC89_13465 [Cytophagaceae bacterium ABcell3]